MAVAAFSEAVRAVFGPRAWLASCSLAVGMTAQLVSGRLTFALGLAFAALCLWALVAGGRRAWLAVAAAMLSALASPVAALFVALAGLTLTLTGLHGRRRAHGRAAGSGWPGDCMRGLATVAAALIPVLVLGLISPQRGSMPFALGTFWPMVAVGAALLVAVAWWRPPAAGALTVAICLYVLGCAAAFAIHTPVGSNAARLGELTAPRRWRC